MAAPLEALMLRLLLAGFVVSTVLPGQLLAQAAPPIVLKPARVYDGVAREAHEGWIVLVKGERIDKAGPAGDIEVPANARIIDLPTATVLTGLIVAQSHLFLHTYNDEIWNAHGLYEPVATHL